MSGLKNKKLRRFLLIAIGIIAAIFAVPFLFTSAILRYYLGKSGIRGYSVQFRSATLSPLGALTINDVEIDDTEESAGRKLMTAQRLRVEFAWTEIG